MKKSLGIIIILLFFHRACLAQDGWLQDIKQKLALASDDTSRVLLIAEVSNYYKLKKPDSALHYGYKALALARKIKFPKGEVKAMQYLIITQNNLGNDSKALQWCLQAIKIAEKNNLRYDIALLTLGKGITYGHSKDFEKALTLFQESKPIFDAFGDLPFSAWTQNQMGNAYLEMNQVDTALYYSKLAYNAAIKIEENWATPYVLLTLGKIQNKLGNSDLALSYLKQSVSMALEPETLFDCYFAVARVYHQMEKPDSSTFYARKAFELARENGFYKDIIEASLLLSSIYENANPTQALLYSKTAIAYQDTLNKLVKSTTQETIADFDVQESQREIEDAKSKFRNRQRMNTFLGISFTLFIIAIFLFRNNKLKQKAKKSIEKAYDQLKSTQSQLIQSEKMASLGELTAGIAHEIQNPLNFVNNFSDVNTELIAEMKQEIDKGNFGEVKTIANDIEENEQKINHHGKRADSIVKGMLQHSRSSSSVKEPTNINALADEYLRLAYHGLRAKDNFFNATMKTDFDNGIGNINVIPQDIGRVLLNLYNNAFYAVKAKASAAADSGYQPTVSVITKKVGDKVLISVRDNGNGIPQNILDKIFQPFFTTKPTGQGTGLGLSLSYDIVKAHGGELKVKTLPVGREGTEGEGAEFIIELPKDESSI